MRLKAKAEAFYKGVRIRKWTEFDFEGETPPKWAVPAGTKAEADKAPQGDTKSIAARKAARKKADPLSAEEEGLV